MPAGDLLTADYQIEVNAVLMRGDGPGAYEIVSTFPDFFRLAPKPADIDLVGDGVAFGTTWQDAVEFGWDVEIIDPAPATLQANLMALRTAWAPADTEVHFRIGGTHYSMEGQPRLFRPDERNRPFGQLIVAVSFKANIHTLATVP